jgi:hypothetical protein
MVGPEDQLASLIPSLVVGRLVTVCFLKIFSAVFGRSDYPTGRILKVNSAIGEAIDLF